MRSGQRSNGLPTDRGRLGKRQQRITQTNLPFTYSQHQQMIRQDDVYKIGKFGKPHGVKGELSFMFNDDVFDRVDADYLVVPVQGILVPFFIEEYRFRTDETALMKFEGIDSQEKARELTNCEVFFPRHLADGCDGDMAWAEIVGFQLIDDIYNKVIGEIVSIDDSTINILFEVRTSDNKQILIPASDDFISLVDRENKKIHVTLPEGLLDLA